MTNKKTNNKQNIRKNKKNTDSKRKFQIVGFICSIILLVFVLIIILKINTSSKSEIKIVMKKFYEYYESKENKVIYYYDSSVKDDKTYLYELDYLLRISKDYSLDYLEVDISKLDDKRKEEIELKLGIERITPTIAVVKSKLVVAVQQGYIESNELVDFLISSGVLEKDSKYIPNDELDFIDYDTYKKMYDDKKSHIVVIGESGCQYCISSKQILNNISKAYKVKISYLNLTHLSKKEIKELFEKLPEYGYDNNKLVEEELFNIPTILIIKKGKIKSYLENLHTLEEYIKYFEDNKVIE